MNDLPRVYVNPIEKKFENFQVTSSSDDRKSIDRRNLSMKIKDIFSSNNYVYKREVRVTQKNKVENVFIVGKSGGYLVTLDGRKIKITDIYDIDVL